LTGIAGLGSVIDKEKELCGSGSQIMGNLFDESIYISVSLTKLTIFAISRIAKNGEECAYERVVKECFNQTCDHRYPP